MKIILESERRIGKNPLDFLQTAHILNGQYVSIGYLNEKSLSKSRRYINATNDAELAKYIDAAGESRFAKDFAAARQNDKYQDALSGKKKTGSFEIGDVHIMDFGRYNFQWKDADRKRDQYETEELPLEHAIRKHYGFTEFEPENEFEEGDWHLNPKYKGPSVLPRVENKDKNNGLGWETPMGNEFFIHNNTKNISFRQVLGETNMREHKFFYVLEADGILEDLDANAFNFLTKAFSNTTEKCEELEEEEKMFLQDLDKLNRMYNHRNFNWEKILYMAGSTVGADANGKKVYEPFLWINDEVISLTYPWLDRECINKLIDDSVRISKKELEDYRKTPSVWESRNNKSDKKALYESIMANVSKEVKKVLNEGVEDDILPAIKGLFKKGQTCTNGWARTTEDFIEKRILSKLDNAGYECVANRKKFVETSGSYKWVLKYVKGDDTVYVQCVNGGDDYDSHGRETGKFTYGNTDVYRGNLYDKFCEKFLNESKKNINESANDLNDRFVIVEAYNDLYDELIEDYADALIFTNGGEPNIFIIYTDDIGVDQYIDKGANVYEIPDGMTIDDFEQRYKNSEIFLEDLDQI